MPDPRRPSQISHHKRHHSWPPFRLRAVHHRKNIEEDPFSFFLSAADDDDAEEYVVDYMNADIRDDSRSRSLSSLHFPISEAKPHSPATTSAILKLKKWVERMESRLLHHSPGSSPRQDTILQSETLSVPTSPPHRGRRTLRRSSMSIGNRAVRSHSGRPRIWQEPGEDIWPVLEEQEDAAGLGISL